MNLVNTMGSGLYLAGSALFFTRGLGLPVTTVSLGMTLGTAIGLATSVGFGLLADKFGPRRIYLALLAVQATVMFVYPLAGTPLRFLLVAVISGIADRGIAGTVGALVHRIAGEGNRVLTRAQLRSTTNVGLAVGTLIAGAALAYDTPRGYEILIWGNGIAFTVSAVLMLRVAEVPRMMPTPTSAGRHTAVLRDFRYVGVTAANAALSLHVSVLSFALPLWVATRTVAPLWIVSVLLIINTVMVIFLQIPVSRLAPDVNGARRLAVTAGLSLGAASLVMFFSTTSVRWLAVILLMIWVILLTLGELSQSTSQFYLSFEMAPENAQGIYQSFFALGPGIVRAIAPLMLTLLIVQGWTLGWLVLAVVFVLAGGALALGAVARNQEIMEGSR